MNKLLTFCLAAGFCFGMQAQDLYLQAGKIIDTKSGKVLSEKTIVVSGKNIKSIEDGFIQSQNVNDSVLDFREMTLLPGLIDMHVHLEEKPIRGNTCNALPIMRPMPLLIRLDLPKPLYWQVLPL